MEILIEFLKIVLPAGLVLYAMYLTVKSFLEKDLKAGAITLKVENDKITLPLRLQAYERMSLFLERISPNNLILRLNSPELSAIQLQHIMLKDIREEFSHNLSQQIYMSNESWNMIKSTVEEIITLINTSAEKLNEDAKGLELSKTIIEALMQNSSDSVSDTLTLVKDEIRSIF